MHSRYADTSAKVSCAWSNLSYYNNIFVVGPGRKERSPPVARSQIGYRNRPSQEARGNSSDTNGIVLRGSLFVGRMLSCQPKQFFPIIRSMKRYSVYAFILTLVVSMASCSTPSGEAQQDPPAATREEKVQVAQSEAIVSVVNEYLSIKNALVASNPESAQAGAVRLLGVVDATEMPTVQQKTKEMAAVTNLDSLRTHFDSLSVALYEEVKEHPDSNQTLYRQYCPMAFDNRGAFWLSNEKEIRNPYFGDKMMSCGRVEEEITF